MTATHPNPPTSQKHHRFHFLDALRGLAAIVIIFRHSPDEFTASLRFFNSFLAVDFFFCLSGFVIAFSYEQRLRDALLFKQFALARIIRLYPTAALGTVLGAIEVLLNRVVDPTVLTTHIPLLLTQLALGFLILPDITIRNGRTPFFPLDGVMWTLFFEIIANFVYAALLRRRFGSTRLIASVALLSAILLGVETTHFPSMDLGWSFNSAPVGLMRVGLSFGLGVLLFRLFHHRKIPALHGVRAGMGTLGIAAALIFLLCSPFKVMQLPFAQLTIVCILFPLLIFAGAHMRIAPRWVSLCVTLGAISYPLYILHLPLLWPLRNPSSRLFAVGHPNLATPIVVTYVAGITALAWFIAEFYDAPLRSFITKKYRSLSTPASKLPFPAPQKIV